MCVSVWVFLLQDEHIYLNGFPWIFTRSTIKASVVGWFVGCLANWSQIYGQKTVFHTIYLFGLTNSHAKCMYTFIKYVYINVWKWLSFVNNYSLI